MSLFLIGVGLLAIAAWLSEQSGKVTGVRSHLLFLGSALPVAVVGVMFMALGVVGY